MAGSISGQPSNAANDIAYKNIQNETVYASADKNTDTSVELSEAKEEYKSIFTNATNGDTLIDTEIGLSRLTDVNGETAKATVKKYLGGTTMGKLINNWTGFGNIHYNAIDINDGEFAGDVQSQIDTQIENAVQRRVQQYTSQITEQYKDALDKAIKQAENELKGDLQADAQKFETRGRKGLTNEQFANIEYKSTSEENGNANERNTNIATFNSSQPDAQKTKGYEKTVEFLQANGAKAQEKVVNGTKQTIYKVKIDGETQYVSVDDAGQVHTMDRDKGFLRSSKYTTDDSIADAKWQVNHDGNTDNNISEDGTKVDVKVRKVDGQNQSVMTWKDDDGKKHSRVIEHNKVAGLTSSLDVNQTNKSGNEINADNIKSTINNIALRAQQAGATVEGTTIETVTKTKTIESEPKEYYGKSGQVIFSDEPTRETITTTDTKITPPQDGITKITINGHTYVLNTKNLEEADRTIRLIENELTMQKNEEPAVRPLADETINITAVEDSRTDTNRADAHEDDFYKTGRSGVENVGVNSPTTPTPKSTKVVRIAYKDDSLSRDHFINEGWAASAGRVDEAKIIEQMDGLKLDGEKSVRNLANAEDFATRLLQVLDKTCKSSSDVENKYDVSKLADALKTANPSIFDNNGDMFKNADFNRINLPKADGLKRYLIKQG